MQSIGSIHLGVDSCLSITAQSRFMHSRVVLLSLSRFYLVVQGLPQFCKDNLTSVTEGRKIIFAGFIFLFVLSYLPVPSVDSIYAFFQEASRFDLVDATSSFFQQVNSKSNLF